MTPNEMEHLHFVHRHGRDQQTQHQPYTSQTKAQTLPSWFHLPCNDSCNYYTMESAQEQSTKGSWFYQPLVALPQAIHIGEYICLNKENDV